MRKAILIGGLVVLAMGLMISGAMAATDTATIVADGASAVNQEARTGIGTAAPYAFGLFGLLLAVRLIKRLVRP